jgi:hypothetical protein
MNIPVCDGRQQQLIQAERQEILKQGQDDEGGAYHYDIEGSDNTTLRGGCRIKSGMTRISIPRCDRRWQQLKKTARPEILKQVQDDEGGGAYCYPITWVKYALEHNNDFSATFACITYLL